MDRLQKIIAHSGYCSRRKAEELITQNKVKVNGVIVNTLGTTVDSNDKIEVEGKALSLNEETVTYLFNKPFGVVSTTSDDRGRKTIVDFFKDVDARVYPVGRLDFNTTGLILVTNDGELANLVMHPSTHLPKTYIATLKSSFNELDLVKLQNGVMLDDGMTAPSQARIIYNGNEAKISLTIHEGRNRQVRRMFFALGYEVKALRREAIGFLHTGTLHHGEYRKLTSDEVIRIKNICKENKKNNVVPDYKKK